MSEPNFLIVDGRIDWFAFQLRLLLCRDNELVLLSVEETGEDAFASYLFEQFGEFWGRAFFESRVSGCSNC